MTVSRNLLVALSAAAALAASTAPANAQTPGQFPGPFSGQIPPQFQGFRGNLPGGAIGNQPGHPPVNNMGALGAGDLRTRFDFRTTMPFPNAPAVVDNPNQNGRNTTIYQNVNTSYLGGLGAGQAAQFGQFGQVGGAPFGGSGQPGIVFGQMVPTGVSGQFGQFGQFGQTTNPAQMGPIGGVGGKFGGNGFSQIGGGGQFGSRYGL